MRSRSLLFYLGLFWLFNRFRLHRLNLFRLRLLNRYQRRRDRFCFRFRKLFFYNLFRFNFKFRLICKRFFRFFDDLLWQRFRKDFRRFFRLDFLNLSKTQFNSPRLLSGQRSICLDGLL